MGHAERFVALVEDARRFIPEITPEALRADLDAGKPVRFLDVREDHEWTAARIPGAEHLGRGILEREIERVEPNPATFIVLYCGGGYRSALAADSLRRMGYTNVHSLAGGIRGWGDAGYPLT